MPKKSSGLKLFTKTWSLNKNHKNDEENKSEELIPSRPLTATLDKPMILDISLVRKIDMSKVRKEFLNISNLCKFPLTITINKRRKTALIHRPLSLPPTKHQSSSSVPMRNPKITPVKRVRKPEMIGAEECWEDDEISLLTLSENSSRAKKSTKSIIAVTNNNKLKIIKDDNNNSKSFKIPRKRVVAGAVSKLLEVKNDLGSATTTTSKSSASSSTKLPEPCRTCGRPDQPERFHSHPATPLKSTRKIDEPPKMKSTVQKPMAIKYKSKQTSERKPPPPQPRKPSLPAQKLVHTPPNLDSQSPSSSLTTPTRSRSGKRTLTCYICGREFGTASLGLHEPKCLERWERENSNLPQNLQRKRPIKPDHPLTQEEWDQFAWDSSQAVLTPCQNCGRTFYPDRLVVHQRSCKTVQDNISNINTITCRSLKMEDSLQTFEGEISVVDTATTPSGENSLTNQSLWAKICLICNNITVEPIIVCYILPCVMASLATQNLNLDKACRVNLQLHSDVCDSLASRNTKGYNQTDEIAVQKLVATMNAWKNVIQSFMPCVLLMFLGSWSDRHKRRKPCFLWPIIGGMLSCVGLLICTFFYYELSMEFNIFFEAIPPSLTGGWFAVFMAIFSYVGGISNVQTRTLRIGAVNIFANLSFTFGNVLSGILIKPIGFYGIFSLALSIYLIGLVYGVLIVKEIPHENLPSDEDQSSTSNNKSFLRDFFDLKHISETFRIAFRKGERNRKMRICTIMVLCMVIVGPMHGEMSVLYLFLRYRFGWSEVDYSIYSTFHVITHIFGTLFSLFFFTKFLKVDDAVLGMISTASRIIASIVYAFAPTSFMFYIGALVEIMNGTLFIAMRSIISKLVPPDELGKINSLFGLSEALVPIIYGPLYSIIYKLTINSLPGMFFIVGAILTIPSIFIFGWLYREHKRDEKDEKLNLREYKEDNTSHVNFA